MKKFLIFCTLAITITFSDAQTVLNEIYTDPGAGNSEFFELYNTSPSGTPENLDNLAIGI